MTGGKKGQSNVEDRKEEGNTAQRQALRAYTNRF